VVNTTHSEPFHVSKSIATLDWVSVGRAGLQARVSATEAEARQFGRRQIGEEGGEPVTELFAEAADFVEVVRRLWDSWEDDAEIRDVATGRFVDRDKLHYVDFEGPWFKVKGPSITPRPPQGQPVVTVLGHVPVAFELAARGADVVFVTPKDAADARSLLVTLRRTEVGVDRWGEPLRVFADLTVFLEEDPARAQARKDRLDALDGRVLTSDAHVFVGSPGALAELIAEWSAEGIDGFRLRPGVVAQDLGAIAGDLTRALRERGLLPDTPRGATLRERLGLTRPPNRFASAPAAHAAGPSRGAPA